MHYGRHFGRTIRALCTVSALINNGMIRMGELAEQPGKILTLEFVLAFVPPISSPLMIVERIHREQEEHRAFKLLILTIPGLEDRLVEGSDEDVAHIAEQVSAFHSNIEPIPLNHLRRFRKALRVRDQTIPRA